MNHGAFNVMLHSLPVMAFCSTDMTSWTAPGGPTPTSSNGILDDISNCSSYKPTMNNLSRVKYNLLVHKRIRNLLEFNAIPGWIRIRSYCVATSNALRKVLRAQWLPTSITFRSNLPNRGLKHLACVIRLDGCAHSLDNLACSWYKDCHERCNGSSLDLKLERCHRSKTSSLRKKQDNATKHHSQYRDRADLAICCFIFATLKKYAFPFLNVPWPIRVFPLSGLQEKTSPWSYV